MIVTNASMAEKSKQKNLKQVINKFEIAIFGEPPYFCMIHHRRAKNAIIIIIIIIALHP